MFWKKKISKTAKNTIIKVMVGWKGGKAQPPPPYKYATGWICVGQGYRSRYLKT